VWVMPRYVAQVSFSEWTSDGKLRHPAFEGLRQDKKPADCVREKPEGSVRRSKRVARKVAARRATAKTPAVEAVELTHPDKVLFPKSGFTKADVFGYYRA